MGNKRVCYIAAIFLRNSLISIANQGNVIKAGNKKTLLKTNKKKMSEEFVIS
jgi:hypothetical protein